MLVKVAVGGSCVGVGNRVSEAIGRDVSIGSRVNVCGIGVAVMDPDGSAVTGAQPVSIITRMIRIRNFKLAMIYDSLSIYFKDNVKKLFSKPHKNFFVFICGSLVSIFTSVIG